MEVLCSTHRLQPCGRHRVSHGYGGNRISTDAEIILLLSNYAGPIPKQLSRGDLYMDFVAVKY